MSKVIVTSRVIAALIAAAVVAAGGKSALQN